MIEIIPILLTMSLMFLNPLGHDRTLVVDHWWVYTSNDCSGNSCTSHTHRTVAGKNGEIVEINRPMWDLFDNMDELYSKIQDLKGHEIVLECTGSDVPMFHWYSQCFKIKSDNGNGW